MMKKILATVIFCITLVLCAYVVHAYSEPICGGNHVYDGYVRDAGYVAVGDAHSCSIHSNCFWVETKAANLMRCACGAEQIVTYDPVIIRHRKY